MNRYILKKNNKHVKGMIFAGCSFTWGQGLHYYNDTPTLPYNNHPQAFDINKLSPSHYEFIKLNRFANRVAAHFQTYSIVRTFNGGSHDAIIDWWKFENNSYSLKNYLEGHAYVIDPRDISFFVLQCTQWARTNIYDQQLKEYFQNLNISLENLPYFNLFLDYETEFLKFLSDTNQYFETFIDNIKKYDIFRLKNMLIEIEKHGIKTLILSWPNDLIKYILEDSWLNDRFISLKYHDKIYNSIEDLDFLIFNDHANFITPPSDHHPSVLAHEIISNSIIEKITKNENGYI